MGIDDESSHPALCSEVADGVTRTIVCLFREPDAGNPPVRFDEREEETELCQTGLRRRGESCAIATGRLPSLRLFSTPLITISGNERQINDNAFLKRSENRITTLLQIPDAGAKFPVRRFVWV